MSASNVTSSPSSVTSGRTSKGERGCNVACTAVLMTMTAIVGAAIISGAVYKSHQKKQLKRKHRQLQGTLKRRRHERNQLQRSLSYGTTPKVSESSSPDVVVCQGDAELGGAQGWDNEIFGPDEPHPASRDPVFRLDMLKEVTSSPDEEFQLDILSTCSPPPDVTHDVSYDARHGVSDDVTHDVSKPG